MTDSDLGDSPMPSPVLPIDTDAQAGGRLAETRVAHEFQRHGWVTSPSAIGTDFGIDMSAYRRSSDRAVLPYALSVQVKSVAKADIDTTGSVRVRVKSSTLASWLWSQTPTVCILVDRTTGQLWWSEPKAPPSRPSAAAAKTRTLRIDKPLNSRSDWESLAADMEALGTTYEGLGAVMDLPLVLQVLTDVALSTDLWTAEMDTSDSIHFSAAVHAYRCVSAINALTGRTGSDDFVSLASRVAHETGRSWGTHLVSRAGQQLGVISSETLFPWADFLVEIFKACGADLAAALPQLNRTVVLAELGFPVIVIDVLARISDIQLALIDPQRAALLSPGDLAQIGDRPVTRSVDNPEVRNRAPVPLAKVRVLGD